MPTSDSSASGSRRSRTASKPRGRGVRTVLSLEQQLARLNRDLEEEISKHHSPARKGSPAAPASSLTQTFFELVAELEKISSSERADEFGLDPEFEELIAPFFVFLYRKWWRVDVEGVDNVPSSGPALLVANHSGAMFPWDGAMLKVALRLDHPAARELRPLIENLAFRMPFVGSFMTRAGGVRACPENATRLLQCGEVVAVFPEGVRGMGKSFAERYHLQRFGRGGFVSICLRTAAPLVPVAIIGAEEIHPLLATWKWPARILGLPYVPITPTFPWLGALGLVPLPTKWTIRFGEPMDLSARYGANRADDPVLIDRISADVQERIQEMVDEMLKERRSVFF